MLKQEFESAAMKNGQTIAPVLFNAVNEYYMETDETKQEFVARAFGNDNTADDILYKVASMRCDENRKALRGNASATPDKLAEYDRMIFSHICGCVKYGIEL